MAKESKPEKKGEPKPEELSFRNNAIAHIKRLQSENDRLKKSASRGRRQQSSTYASARYGNQLAGLQQLGSRPSLPTS